ncbi:DUF2589 domain-containing protein, partial [Xanthovirga aplysinae]|uniref:DUF2589 domain-containing protein n=1 Tax=Xanthovirga aplysinae TaxID=2529853 RepID=UPI0012BCC950
MDKHDNNKYSINKVKSLSLYQLIGAPLHALVEAEVQAVQSSLQYILTHGFEQNGEEEGYGKLKMLTFTHKGTNSNGQEVIKETSIPLLTLLPIPLLSIKNAELEFNLKVTDFKRESLSPLNKTYGKKDLEQDRALSPDRIGFSATMGVNSRENTSSTDYQIRVKMNVEQSDMPSGLSKLLGLVEEESSSKVKHP